MSKHISQEVPRKIWMYWAQGENDAPFLVKRCIERMVALNPDWEVTVLDDSNVGDFVDLSDLPGFLPFRYRSDILRLRLLRKYGGVWADATVFLHKGLSEWLPLFASKGFFVFKHPAADRMVESWFIASSRNNELVAAWEGAFSNYLRGLPCVPEAYFVVYYVFQWQLLKSKSLMQKFALTPSLPAPPSFFFQSLLESRVDLCHVQNWVARGWPLSKLNWRLASLDESSFDRYVKVLDDNRGNFELK